MFASLIEAFEIREFENFDVLLNSADFLSILIGLVYLDFKTQSDGEAI